MESNITNKGWRVAGNTGVVLDKDGWMVAHAGCSHEAAISADFNREISSRQECAHLIAAAPDMYDVLQGIKRVFEDNPYQRATLWFEDLEKALAKAEGK